MKKTLVLVLVLLLVMPIGVYAEGTVVDVATSSDEFSILVTALQQEGLVETLQGDGPFTVFAPTDAAFADLLAALDITAEGLLAREDLTDILLYHVVPGKVMSTDLSDGLTAETVNGAEVMFDLSDGVMVNDSTVVTADLEADNGVVHVIDKVLLPPSEMTESELPATVVDIANSSDDFSILVTALQQEGLVETLQGEGPFTVFAPTNAAFADLLAELDITTEELLANEDLTNILLYHVVSGKVMSSDLTNGLEAATVNGATVMFDLSDGVMVNDSTVVTADLEADNGVVHVIDKVLLPTAEEEMPETGVATGMGFIMLASVSGLGYILTKKNQ